MTIHERWQMFRNRPWLGSWEQRFGSRVLLWWDERYPPMFRAGLRPTPWLFRGDHGFYTLLVLLVLAIILINA